MVIVSAVLLLAATAAGICSATTVQVQQCADGRCSADADVSELSLLQTALAVQKSAPEPLVSRTPCDAGVPGASVFDAVGDEATPMIPPLTPEPTPKATPEPTPKATPCPTAGDTKKCTPKCNWKCQTRSCEEECKPVCDKPRCQTRCTAKDANANTNGCTVTCDGEPSCTTVCKGSCAGLECPGCETQCGKPTCRVTCPQECHEECDTPMCKWDCAKPKESKCPKPDCTLSCDAAHCTSGGGAKDWKPRKADEIVVKNYEVTPENQSLLQLAQAKNKKSSQTVQVVVYSAVEQSGSQELKHVSHTVTLPLA